MKKYITIFINLILIIMLMYSSYNIYTRIKAYNEDKNTYHEIRVIKSTYPNKYNNALTKNNINFKFWLKIDNTNIDYPVVQGKDNDFYLTHDFNRNTSKSGSIFVDFRNDINNDKNIIIYGHNMKNKTMFSNLEKFKNEEFFNENNKIRIDFDDKQYLYEVFSVYYTKSDYNYIITNFNNDEDYKLYLNNTLSKSMYNYSNSISINDKIITLSTCSYESSNTRTVVHAKLLSVNNK